MFLPGQIQRDVVPVEKTKVGQVQFFVRRDRMPKPLFQKRRKRFVVVTLAPGTVHTANPYCGIGNTLHTKRNAFCYRNKAFLHVGAVKKRYFCILADHLNSPCCLPSKPRSVLKVSLLLEVGRAPGFYL